MKKNDIPGEILDLMNEELSGHYYVFNGDLEEETIGQLFYSLPCSIAQAFGLETAKKWVYKMVDDGFHDLEGQIVSMRKGLKEGEYLSKEAIKSICKKSWENYKG